MKQKRISMRGLLAVVLLLFFGCSHKVEPPAVLKPDKVYLEALRHTQKGDLSISLENKALLIATYLNPIDGNDDGERFFVRIYIDNDFSDDNRSGLYHPGYELTLNDTKPLEIRQLSSESLLIKSMPFTQKWYRYYIVRFPKGSHKPLELRLSHPDYGSVVLTFEDSR